MSNQTLEKFRAERTTVWDFPVRGDWATHKGDYRGNFAPQIARNVILNYCAEGELVLDPMVGSGTTLIEARLLNRNGLGLDCNDKAVAISRERIHFEVENASKQVPAPGELALRARVLGRRRVQDDGEPEAEAHPVVLRL